MFPNSNKSSPKTHTQLYISEFKISLEQQFISKCFVLYCKDPTVLERNQRDQMIPPRAVTSQWWGGRTLHKKSLKAGDFLFIFINQR